MKPFFGKSYLLLFAVFFSLVTTTVFAETIKVRNETEVSTGRKYLGYSFDLGVSFKQISLDVFDKGATDALGILTDDFVISYSLGVGTPSKYLFDSNVAVTFLMNYSAIKMDTQEVDSEDIDLGTSATGFFAYITPVLFYNFGDKEIQEGKKLHAFKIGLGAGIGYLKAKGDVIFTETPSQERHVFDIKEYSFSGALFFDYRYDRVFSRITLAGPEITDGPFEYNLFDISWDIGTRFDL